MRLPANEKRMFLIAFCGSLYWAASVLLTMTWKSTSGSLGSLGTASAAIVPVSVCTVAVFYFARAAFFKRGFQLALAGSIIASIATVIVVSAFGLMGHPVGHALSLVLPGYCSGCSIVFWGLNFASLSKEESEKTVFITLAFTAILYLAGSAMPMGELGYYAAEAMKALAVVPFLFGRYELTVVERRRNPGEGALLVPFATSRCFFGIAIGIVVALSASAAEPSLSWELLVPCGLLLAAVAWFLRKASKFSAYLRVAPLLLVVPLVLPYLGSGGLSEPLRQGAYALIWLSWIVLSSVQLSDLKEKLGWDEAHLVLFEKLVVMVPWLVAGYATDYLAMALPEQDFALCAALAPGLLTFAAMTVSCYLLSELIANKERQRLVESALKRTKDELDVLCKSIASEYRLTSREKEVFTLLAKGCTRPTVCEQLVISEGTARSHIDHVYKKLCIHSREELHALVNEKRGLSDASRRVGG